MLENYFTRHGATEWKVEKAAETLTPTYKEAGKVDFQGKTHYINSLLDVW